MPVQPALYAKSLTSFYTPKESDWPRIQLGIKMFMPIKNQFFFLEKVKHHYQSAYSKVPKAYPVD